MSLLGKYFDSFFARNQMSQNAGPARKIIRYILPLIGIALNIVALVYGAQGIGNCPVQFKLPYWIIIITSVTIFLLASRFLLSFIPVTFVRENGFIFKFKFIIFNKKFYKFFFKVPFMGS